METKQVIRVIPFILITACGLLTSCSGGGMTLGEIDKLSPSERSVIQELKITDIKGDGELNLTETWLQKFKEIGNSQKFHRYINGRSMPWSNTTLGNINCKRCNDNRMGNV